MNEQLQRAGAVLSSHAEMIKGFLGPQFAVTIVARNVTGPFHLMLGDDDEPTLIKALEELAQIGTALVEPEAEPDTSTDLPEHTCPKCSRRFWSDAANFCPYGCGPMPPSDQLTECYGDPFLHIRATAEIDGTGDQPTGLMTQQLIASATTTPIGTGSDLAVFATSTVVENSGVLDPDVVKGATLGLNGSGKVSHVGVGGHLFDLNAPRICSRCVMKLKAGEVICPVCDSRAVPVEL